MSLTYSQRTQLRHWVARIGCLIVLPILVYVACFKIHFLILNHTGPGDAQMSSLFQANLVGNDFSQSPLGQLSVLCSIFVLICLQRSPLAPK
jgi:dolichyl-phosphate-mannose-protein mannosyltransferase